MHTFVYRTDEEGKWTTLFNSENAASILISFEMTQLGGENAGGTEGNLWAGHLYILGSGTASPFSDKWTNSPKSAVTPEPATLLICGFGLAGLAAVRKRRNK